MARYILGISHFWRNSSAALLKDGKIIAAAEEERFTREKLAGSFPKNAIAFCLDYAGISAEELALLAVSSKNKKTLDSFRREFGSPKKTIRVGIKEAFAAASFLASPFKRAAILIEDSSSGKNLSLTGIGDGKRVRFDWCLERHGISQLYSQVSSHLGFSLKESEYKLMGLSGFGTNDREKNQFYTRFMSLISVDKDGRVFVKPARMQEVLCVPARKKDSAIRKEHKDIACAMQMALEDAMINSLNKIQKKSGEKNLVLGGDVALNGLLNGKILRKTAFEKIWILPNPGVGGLSIGAAAHACSLLGERAKSFQNAFLGPKYSEREIKTFLEEKNTRYTRFPDVAALLKKTAELIKRGDIVSWFEGRMEWGPRALGARSILASPKNKRMKKILNVRVKHRESFMPFAPSVCEDDAKKYFDCDWPLPRPADFMLMVYPVREEYRRKIPSATHVDGSGRLHVVRKKENPLFYSLLKEFGRLSGTRVILNTSFNVRGEPIVRSPKEAYACFMNTKMDYLVIGEFLISKQDSKKLIKKKK